METALDIAQLVATVAVAIVVILKRKVAGLDMHSLGRQYAEVAVSHAAQMGGDDKAKLAHALDAFRLADMKDGKRDFTDAQARVLIEAEVAKRKS